MEESGGGLNAGDLGAGSSDLGFGASESGESLPDYLEEEDFEAALSTPPGVQFFVRGLIELSLVTLGILM